MIHHLFFPQHLSANMFPLLVFGRLVEEEMGGFGLLITFIICGVRIFYVHLSLPPFASNCLGTLNRCYTGILEHCLEVFVALQHHRLGCVRRHLRSIYRRGKLLQTGLPRAPEGVYPW